MKSFTFTERRQAARAWADGGYMLLSRWLSHVRPRFGVAEYGAAVAAAREELGDDTDYSQDTPARGADGR